MDTMQTQINRAISSVINNRARREIMSTMANFPLLWTKVALGRESPQMGLVFVISEEGKR